MKSRQLPEIAIAANDNELKASSFKAENSSQQQKIRRIKMTSFCMSLSSGFIPKALNIKQQPSSGSNRRCTPSLGPLLKMRNRVVKRNQSQVVCMAPDEERLTRRNPLDFPIEWDRPKPGRRPDIFPQFSPMKTPLPPPMPYDPPEEDEDEEEEEEDDPDKEESDQPDRQ